jgi:hypothetical protein
MVASYEHQALHLMHQYVGSHQAWSTADGELADKLKQHQTEFQRRLAAKLNEYRSISPGQLAVISYEEGDCGGGNPGADLQVHIRPPNGQAFVITFFKFDLCEKQGYDPRNRTKCNYWMEAMDNSTINIAGQNRYLAHWRDGAIREGTISDKGKKDGDPFNIIKPE